MKLKITKICWSSLILVFYVNSVHTQFAKGVVKNNVFSHYMNKSSGGSLDHSVFNQNTTNFGYYKSTINPTMTSPLPYSMLAAINPTTGVHRSNYRLQKPGSTAWNGETAKPVIAYTLPPNMKLKLENAVRQGHLGSRSRTTKKMNTATTPDYEAPELNGIIIKNFINHLSTTKANIESTIPNPNQFYTTPSSVGGDTEPLMIMNSNAFFPASEMNLNNMNDGMKHEQQDDESPPIIVAGPTNTNQIPAQYHNAINSSPTVAQAPPLKYHQVTPQPVRSTVPLQPVRSTVSPQSVRNTVPPPKISQIPAQTSTNQKVRVPGRKPIRRRPQSQQQVVKVPTTSTSLNHTIQTAQHNKQQFVKVPTTKPSQIVQSLGNAPNKVDIQQNKPANSSPSNPTSTHVVPQYFQNQSQHQSPVILTPTKENSLNIYNGVASQQLAEPVLLSSPTSSVNSYNSEVGQYPINPVANQQTAQLMNSLSPLQTLTGQQVGYNNQTFYQQSVLPMSQDSIINRPNNALKQLQLQFLLDCNLLDPLTKTKIPLGTNPVGDDFFFTPMPYTNQNPQFAPVNVKQIPFNPFNPQTYLPSFPNLFTTTPPPITAVILTDSTTQTTQQPVYVSVQPTQNSHRRKNKKKVKNVYVDLPIVSEVGNMLDKVYNFMEESLVTKVVKKTETQPARRGQATNTQQTSHNQNHNQNQVPQIVQVIPSNQIVAVSAIDGSSDEDYPHHRYTTPYYRTTRSRRQRPKRRRRPSPYYSNRLPINNWQPISFHRQKRTTLVPNDIVNKDNRNKNYLTTKIHVTSEYVGPQPTESIDYPVKKKVTKSSEEDDDDYYEDSFPYLSFDSLGEEDDDDDDEDDDSDSNSVQTNDDSASVQVTRINSKKQKRNEVKKKIRKNSKEPSLESESYEDDVDDGDDDDSNNSNGDYNLPSMGMFGDFFGNMVSSVNKYVPSMGKLPSISGYIPSIGTYFRGGSGSKELDSNNIDREERSTTPQIETRNPKNPKQIFSDYNDYNGIDGPEGNGGDSWYYPFFGSNEVTTATPVITDASNDYWNWFGNSNENVESSTDSTATNQNNSGWLFGLFGSEESSSQATTTTPTTTTTKRPFLTVDNPMYKPHNWLGIMASHLLMNKPINNTPSAPQRVSYDNYQLWRLMPESADQVKFLEDYRTTPEGVKLQWWKGPTLRGPTDVVVPPNLMADVKVSLNYEEIPHEVILWDLGKAIRFENPPMSRREKLEIEITQEHPMSWYRYHRYKDIVKFLEFLQRKYPSSVELIHIGKSFEGRPLIVAKVSGPRNSNSWKSKSNEKKKKKTSRHSVFIESGTHAREWITPAVATWILDKLVNGLNSSDALGETIRSVDWYIMPVLNPDGYEYSHQFDRLWRKTRSKHREESSLLSNAFNWLRREQKEKEGICYGTDLNRNWNHNWNEKGSSKSECSEFYAGPNAFSEPETKALSKFLEEQKKNIKLYLSLHSYGQIISYPSRANASYNSIKSDDLLEMAQVALEALRGSGSSTRYVVDNTNEMMYARSGSSDLYTMYDLGIKYSYALELRDSGTHGFLLPPSNIDSTAKETFEIIKGMVDYV
ncbi:uncharacterized protein LOC119068842 [Bradysia coprophila]|uniref:uncharacterized protein LOC119068842 n=1 Tax=Bradysia coprophila TaxID=38358 RepID=UPI00187D8EB1|nr:uncharacterized protein LOC119068842 [Bradysia coprophila]